MYYYIYIIQPVNQSVVSHHYWHQSSKVFPWIETTCSTFKKVPEKPWQSLKAPELGRKASHLGSSHPMLIPDIPCMVCYIPHIWCVMVVSTDYVCVKLGCSSKNVQLWLEWCWILTHLHLPINGHGSTLAYQWTRYMFDAWYSIWLAGKCSLKQRFEKGSCWTKFH